MVSQITMENSASTSSTAVGVKMGAGGDNGVSSETTSSAWQQSEAESQRLSLSSNPDCATAEAFANHWSQLRVITTQVHRSFNSRKMPGVNMFHKGIISLMYFL